eukprot:m.89451 g.89451  ORF g.89451 m.89451 type:complete len:385 (-) comp18122_c0_seq1:96-1250(-)
MRAVVAVFVMALAGAVVADKCKMPQDWPPNPDRALPWKTINLDLPPQERWVDAVKPMAAQIQDMIVSVVDLLPAELRKVLMEKIDAKAEELVSAMPAPYGDEIKGIANATGIDLGLLFLYNVAYELEGVCTSIVAQNSNGHIYHVRNLDFGLFLGIDKQNSSWQLTEKLRPLLFNARFVKGGKDLFNATVFGGYVGLLTGMKQGGFSITVDTRFDDNLDKGLIRWIDGKDRSGDFLSFLTRSVMETNTTYAEAYDSLNKVPLIGPAYLILGGAKAGEGAVITREEAKSLNPWTLEMSLKNGSFYVLETNYDHWVKAPFYDDRRTPAQDCLKQIGPDNVSVETLFNLLSGRPNLNMLTTYSTLMDVEGGTLQAFHQQCDWPCAPW